MNAVPAPAAPSDPVVRSAVGKIFRRVVPLFFVMFVANYIDRVAPNPKAPADSPTSALRAEGLAHPHH